jgi:hypothetical protein
MESTFQAVLEQLSKLSTGPEELRFDIISRKDEMAALQELKKDTSTGQDEFVANQENSERT